MNPTISAVDSISSDGFPSEYWTRRASGLRRLCSRWMGGHRADGEEAFSRACLQIYRKLPLRRDPAGHLEAWIRRVAYNVCMDLHRENRRRAERQSDLEFLADQPSTPDRLPTVDPESNLLRQELNCKIDEAIRALPDRLRITFEIYLETESYREVAGQLSITEVNARKRVQQARAASREMLQSYQSRISS